MELAVIRQHWLRSAKKYSADLAATTKTTTIKQLEINAIYRAIQKTRYFSEKENRIHVLEVGCGNGHNCFALAKLLPHFNFTGVDYIPAMIRSAQESQKKKGSKRSRVNFTVANALRLGENRQIRHEYEIVFTDRCLINLNSTALQMRAVREMSKKVKRGGYLILLENFRENYNEQNKCRKMLGLPKRIPAPYNLFMNEKALLRQSSKTMRLISISDFGSLHDLVLYVLLPTVNGGKVEYEHPLVDAATRLSLSLKDKTDNGFGCFGQNRLFLFQKRGKE